MQRAEEKKGLCRDKIDKAKKSYLVKIPYDTKE
jgi:hypothetical protein